MQLLYIYIILQQTFVGSTGGWNHSVKIRPRKACRYPNLRSFEWVSYDKVGGLYSGKLEIRSEARASDLRSYPGLWWKRINLHLYEGTKVSTPRTCSIGRPAGGTLCPPPINFTSGVVELDMLLWQRSSGLSVFFFRSDFAFAFHRAHNPK